MSTSTEWAEVLRNLSNEELRQVAVAVLVEGRKRRDAEMADQIKEYGGE
jgi:hypothetical protein